MVVFAVRRDSYAGLGEVRGGEVIHRVCRYGCGVDGGRVCGGAAERRRVGRGFWVCGTLSKGVAEEKEWETGGVGGLWRTRG
jgi:hypothetical protein